MASKNWDKLLVNAPAISFRGSLKRVVAQLSYNQSLQYLFTSGQRNRCNPKGVYCIYMSEDRETALAEFDKYYTDVGDDQPSVTYTGKLRAGAIIDLGDPAIVAHFGITNSDFFTPFRTKKRMTRLEKLGEAISRQTKVTAIRFPSDAMNQQGKTGYNLVIFRDAVQSPDTLRISGPGTTVLEEWP